MLRKFKLSEPFRSLSGKVYPEDGALGRRTIIYGHNGSGKSSLAELLHHIGAGKHSSPVEWHDDNGKKHILKAHSSPQNVVISSFCKSWVKDNVSAFLDGESAAAIVVLGQEAKEAKDREKKLQDLIEQQKTNEANVLQELEILRDTSKSIVQSVQVSIEGNLRDFDNRRFTKNKFNSIRVAQLLLEAVEVNIDEAQHAKNLNSLKQTERKEINLKRSPDPDWVQLVKRTNSILHHDVQSEIIAEILGNAPLQTWLEQGISLHEDEESCQFCEQALSSRRLNQLRRHFDASRKYVQDQVVLLSEEVRAAEQEINSWWQNLPAVENIEPTLSGVYLDARNSDMVNMEAANRVLKNLSQILTDKFDSPERTDLNFELPELEPLDKSLATVCKQHDEMISSAEERKSALAEDVLGYLIASQAEPYRTVRLREDKKSGEHKRIIDDLKDLHTEIIRERAKQLSSGKMATQISRDLQTVYGRNHLSIQVSDDGKNYKCMRNGQPAKNLSDGERNSLALIYFLRHLEDEEVNVDSNSRLIIVDDPSSSLDREAVFATHSWLLESLKRYGQTIILTHDFEMLRLFLNSQSNQLSIHRRVIREGSIPTASSEKKSEKETELQYPRISFLEMRTRAEPNQNRRSILEPLSETFLNFRSEYHFLFDRLLTGLEQPENHELIFLLPNAARRIFESFAAFHVPGRPKFRDQLEKIALEDRDAPYQDVLDFLNRYSHGEGREPQLVLDATTVSSQIRRTLELLKTAAPEHYRAMCQAVGRKNRDPLTDQPW